jgi:hypothetical protein
MNSSHHRQLGKLDCIFDNLFQTKAEHPFHGIETTHAYIVRRPQQDSFIAYSSSFIKDYFDELDLLGTIKYQLLTHRDEASIACNLLRDKYNSKVICHQREVEAIEGKQVTVDHRILEDTTIDKGKYKNKVRIN